MVTIVSYIKYSEPKGFFIQNYRWNQKVQIDETHKEFRNSRGEKKMSTIVHFDVPADDIQRAKTFYETVFNWEITRVPGPMGYYNIGTKDDQGTPSLGGGMGQRGDPSQKITNYIGVSSVDDYIKKVKDHGGTIIMPKTTIPGFGYLATFIDTEGNPMGLWETDPNATIEG